jgi:sugar lactone lactonase YvrE
VRALIPSGAILPSLSSTPTLSVSTVPANGDLNPYGVAFVPIGFAAGAGPLHPGDILVSNFNNSANLQGTGTTIVRISASGQQSLFFQGKRTLGLTTALGVLRAGFVIVGNVPSLTPRATCTQGADGPERGVSAGSLLILDATGIVVATLDDKLLAGPWDLAVRDQGSTAQIFVSDVLSGTVTRLDLAASSAGVQVAAETQIASGYAHRCDPAAFVVGPTGLAWNPATDMLYVASTGDNAIFAVASASTATSDNGKGTQVVNDHAHLHGPLGLALASNGDLISSQGDAVNPDASHPSEIVEFTPRGQFVSKFSFVSQFSIDPAPGSAFGLALMQTRTGFVFAAVDDATNVLDIWKVQR